MSDQNNNDEAKQKLWKIYKIIMLGMVGSAVLILFVQWLFGAIQNFMREQKNANLPQANVSSTTPQQQVTPTVTPSQVASAITPTPTSSILPVSEEFTEQHAQALVKRYLDAKPSIYAPPFNRQIVVELTTGKLRTEIMQGVNWIQSNNGYYQYGFRSVGTTGKIYYNGDSSAVAELRVIEKYTYYQNGNLDPTQGDYYDTVVRWAFQKEDGVWKISDREITKKSR